MSRSQSEIADLICPTCGEPFNAEVWLVIDRQERPDLHQLIMDGELNVAQCSRCSAEGGVNHPLLFHDREREQVVVAMPLTVKGEEVARELVGELLARLLDCIPSEDRHPYLGDVELVPELDGLRALLLEQTQADNHAAHDRQLAIALQDLLNVNDAHDFERVISQHRSVLLTDRAETALDDMARNARQSQDRELQRRAKEARAILNRMCMIVTSRRAALNALLDELAPLSDDEIAVLPQLKQMLAAIDPQEAYTARISLTSTKQAIIDQLIERLLKLADEQQQTEELAFLRHLIRLPQQ
jgi:hypothetical protein